MFGCNFGTMMLSVTIGTKIGIFNSTIHLCKFRGNLDTIITNRFLLLFLLPCIDRKINEKARVNLIVLEHHILVHKHMRVLLLLIKVYGVESFRTWDLLAIVIFQRIAVRFPHCEFVEKVYEFLLWLRVELAVIADIKKHTLRRNFEPFLWNLIQSIGLSQFIRFNKRFQHNGPSRVVIKGRADMRVWNIIHFICHRRCRPQSQLQLELRQFPIIRWRLHRTLWLFALLLGHLIVVHLSVRWCPMFIILIVYDLITTRMAIHQVWNIV